MNKRVVIIGAGWYGCYLGYVCKMRDIEYVIYERSSEIFNGASFYNQNRLHLGYHYPRDFKTRNDSKKGFDLFNNNFPELTCEIKKNIYAIHKNSLIDYQTYINIFKYEKYDFEILGYNLSDNFQGAILVNEKFIDPFKSKHFFESLNLNIHFNSEVILKNGFYYFQNKKLIADKIINATYGGIETKSTLNEFKHQNFISFIIRKTVNTVEFDALTVMDGEFYSIYPYNLSENLYTLTHVKHGIFEDQISEKEIKNRFKVISSSICRDLPNFLNIFEYYSYFTSRKYKSVSFSDMRSTLLYNEENTTVICSGKIDTVFLTNKIIDEI